ncbi:MAG: S8 family serine peptidase [bacterium]|nr:S8 family serine peptidase [bacterium]
MKNLRFKSLLILACFFAVSILPLNAQEIHQGTGLVTVNVLVSESRLSDAAIAAALQSASPAPFTQINSLGGFGRPSSNTAYGKRLYSLTLLPSYANRFLRAVRSTPNVLLAEQEQIGYANMDPNDPYYGLQWGLPKVEAPAGFDIEMGNSEVVIAIVDTGVDLDHPDLVSKLLPGYDAVDGDSVPEDVNGHGTRMAGIATATTMNNQGIAGMCPNCKLLPLRAGYPNSTFSASKVFLAVEYALDNPRGIEGIPDNPNPADVISLSASFPGESDYLLWSVEDAAALNVPFVASAGNQGWDGPRYPAAYDNVISVAATDQNDQRYSNSNYGDWVTLAAPGVDIWTTSLNGTYATSTGTSPAAPLVAGTIALMRSRAVNMTLSPDDIRDILIASSDPVYGFPDIVGGRLNARAALELTPNGHTPPYIPRFKKPFPMSDGG